MNRFAAVLLPVAAALLASPLPAIDFSEFSDLDFAERYAFSTNRAGLVDRLQRGKAPWYFYSILNLQTEGRIAEAGALLREAGDCQAAGAAWRALRLRQAFLDWTRSREDRLPARKDADRELAAALKACGVREPHCVRETAAAPDVWPSTLDPARVGYEAFAAQSSGAGGWIPRYDFLVELRRGGERPDSLLKSQLRQPNEPGLVDALAKAFARQQNRYESCPATAGLTLDQLAELRRRGVAVDEAFIADVLLRLRPAVGEDVDGDPQVRRAWLDRVLAFAATLDAGHVRHRLAAMSDILEFERSRGNFSERRLLLDYLRTETARGSGGRRPVNAMVADYLAAYRRGGDDLSEFAELVDGRELARIAAETDLLAGVDQARVDLGAIGESAFRALRDRVEIVWAAGNPVAFAAADPVTLQVDVKNVPRMRVAVYEIDAFRALCRLGGEIGSDIDLDGCVPTWETTLDCARHPPIVRHRETLRLPQLDRPGIYVVECSGGGVSSRAVVRKGTLRVSERIESCGHVFTAMDEEGRPLAGARMSLDGTAYEADDAGEIAVPFAGPESAGPSLAVVGAGALAVARRFDRRGETYALAMDAFLPPEAIVAGAAAEAVLAPRLTVAGAPASLSILRSPRLEVALVDIHGVGSVRKAEQLELSDRGELRFRFTVPEGLASVRFTLRGSVRNLSQDRDEELSAVRTLAFNGILRTDRIEQALLRRDGSGYALELRGRNGEPLAARELKLAFQHRCFEHSVEVVLQTGADGTVRLGRLPGIDDVSLQAPFAARWRIADDDGARPPAALAVAAGEPIELRVPGLSPRDGAWPLSDRLDAALSLVAVNDANAVVRDCTSAAAVDADGVLSVKPLPAGRYRLYLRALDHTIDLRVAPCTVAADRARRLRIAAVDAAAGPGGGPRRIAVRLANASEDARVHLVGRRYVPSAGGGDLFAMLSQARNCAPGAAVELGRVRSDYISGRNLGDELRYILDRRLQPRRPGNMLERPSLLVHPWSRQTTRTGEQAVREGEAWEAGEASGAKAPCTVDAARRVVLESVRPKSDSPACGFLAQNGRVWCNCRPDADGVAVFELPEGLDFCDFVAVATDGDAVDSRHWTREAPPAGRRDLRVRAGAAAPPRTREYADLESVYAMILANAGVEHLDRFGFAVRWPSLSPERRRELYGEYAGHELDLFLFCRDRPFFESVVLPGLKNKRRKDFVDRWLLGEDLSAWRRPAAWRELNAFERCLLAWREPAVAGEIAAQLRQWCEAHPVAPETEDRRLLAALGMGSAAAANGGADRAAPEPVCMAMVDEEPTEDAAASAECDRSAGAGKRRTARGNLRKSARRRDAVRQPYRPPAATREWTETGYYRRRAQSGTGDLAAPGRFWRDFAAAIAGGGGTADFRPQSFVDLVDAGSLAEAMAALAVIDLPWTAQDGGARIALAVREPRGEAPAALRLPVTQQFADPRRSREGEPAYEREEFAAGRRYTLLTVVSNPTGRRLRVQLERRLPEGSMALAGGREQATITRNIAPFGSYCDEVEFYFPSAEGEPGRLSPAVASVDGLVAGRGEPFACRVVARSAREDRASWQWISQQGDDAAVLEFLRTANLESDAVSLAKIGWRMGDGDFARRVYDTLSARGVFDPLLWRLALFSRAGIDGFRNEVRELLMSGDVLRLVAPRIGPSFHCPLVDVEPETADLFEYAEYWPLVNARAHRLGGAATIANESLRRQYRQFLDLLATRRRPTARDRLDAAVYLVAQDRTDEARAFAAGVRGEEVETRMQLDYLRAYFAFSELRPEQAREIALAYADWPDDRWRGRFRRVVEQADEIAGRAPGERRERTAAELAPSIGLSAETSGGETGTIVVSARNIERCVVRVFRTDLEVGFSKHPFADGPRQDASALLKSAWETVVEPDAGGRAEVRLPDGLRGENLLVEAADGEGRATATLPVLSCSLDVQVAAEYGELRVRDREGRPLPGAYVKVYARDASGREVKFHKDGYTDLRGAFDYASVSSDGAFRPAGLAVLVMHEGSGARTFVVRAP